MRLPRIAPALLAGAILCLAPLTPAPAGFAAPETSAKAAAAPGSKAEAEDYQRREAQSPGLAQFEGGDAIVTIAFLGAIVLIVYFIIDHHEHSHREVTPTK